MISNTGKLAGKTLFVTGASRGIGKVIALKAAQDGANVVIAAKTAEPHPKLPGTIFTAADEIEKAGGKALPCIVDVRDEKQVQSAIDKAVKLFGGIDILINNASAVSMTDTLSTDMKRYDLMQSINTRGTFLVSKLCVPHLKQSSHAHILNLSPPLNLNPIWFSKHVAYTMAKYGMSMCVLGMSEEFKPYNIGVNALWPQTIIDTAALNIITGGNDWSRKPEIVSDAAYVILTKDPKTCTGNFFVDEQVLRDAGVEDFRPYACHPEQADKLMMDGFLDVPLGGAGGSGMAFQSAAGHMHTTAANYKEEKGREGGKVSDLFGAISKSLSTELVQKTQAVFQFNVKGAEEGVWHLDLKHGSGACGQGEPATPADATLTMDSNNFTDMFAGKIKPAAAFMMGKLKIGGDMQKALKLEKLMQALKAKM